MIGKKISEIRKSIRKNIIETAKSIKKKNKKILTNITKSIKKKNYINYKIHKENKLPTKYLKTIKKIIYI